MNKENRNCLFCSKDYIANPVRVRHGRELFCSRDCSYKYRGEKKVKQNKKWTKEFEKSYSAAYRKTHAERLRIINRAWKIANAERVRSLNKEERARLKMDVFIAYSKGKPISCCECGYADLRALDIDHMNDDGAAKRRGLFGDRLSAGTTYYRWLRKNGYPSGYQILCRNCNWIKKLNADNKIAVPV